MVPCRRSTSKEDVCSVLADSGVSLSSPPSSTYHLRHFPCNSNLTEDEEEAILAQLCVTDDDENDDDDENTDDNVKEKLIIDESTNNSRISSNSRSRSSSHSSSNRSVDNVQSVSTNDEDYTELKNQTKENINEIEEQLKQQPNAEIQLKQIKVKNRRETEDYKLTKDDDACNDNNVNFSTIAIVNGNKKLRKSYICDVCKKEFGGNTDLKRHKLIHSDERPFTCDQCGKHYRQAINLKNHVVTAHAKVKTYSCDQCPKAFALKERLKLHMRLHSGEKPYNCPECQKQFARGGQLHQHMVSHHQNVSKKFKCEKCSARFSTTSNLKAHMERHENGPEHYCELCKEHFVNDVFLKAHRNKVHMERKMIICEICNKSIDERHLTTHAKTHSNMKSHVCQVCNLLFTQKSQYNVHMRMHTGERPYQCSICCQAFAHSSVLKLHIRKHTGEKPFVCMLCKDDVAFSQLAHLKTHMKKIHNQCKSYMCEGCHEFYKIKIELEAHQQKCAKYSINIEEQEARCHESQLLSHIRFHMAILLKKITSDQKLQQLGFEKRLIDNVVVASLTLAKRKVCSDVNLTPMERMRRNVEEFLNWTVPLEVMQQFREQKLSVESILEKIVSMYMKQKK